ncbi:MAG: cellulase family glycosylhydrolase [Phycisphaeraceae bacterium]|nr:cellulase family glycosylhydrolase [Phycisphaeraceae bacterium]
MSLPVFDIQRGTNISHWLSQSEKRGAERRAWFSQADVERIAGWGFDHIRLPVDEEQMWDEKGQREEEAFALLGAALKWSQQAGLRVIVDLHLLRSHTFLSSDNALFSDPAAAGHFADVWRDLGEFLHTYPLDGVGYELMNEPMAKDAKDWNRVAHLGLAAIREREKERVVILGSNECQSSKTFDQLAVPANDPALILSLHYYNPFPLTHYQASWTDIGKYQGPVRYPGRLIADADFRAIEKEDWAGSVRDGLMEWNREALAAKLPKPLAVRERTGLRLYCGEFGCLHTVPQADRVRWYRDIVSIFREKKIAYANWDYKGGFGLLKKDGTEDREVIACLVGKA